MTDQGTQVQSDEVTTRQAKLDDVEAIAHLFALDMAHLRVETTLEAQMDFTHQMLQSAQQDVPSCVCWVAEHHEEVVGVIMANFYWSVKFASQTLWIEALFIRPDHRRMGLGRLLVDTLLDWAEERGVLGVDIEAYHRNTPASVLYRTSGFWRLGRERFHLKLDPVEE